MGFYLLGLLGHRVCGPFEYEGLVVRVHEGYLRMRIHYGGILEVLEDRLLPGYVPSFCVVLYAGSAALALPGEGFLVSDYGAVRLRVYDDVHAPGDRILPLYLGLDPGRFARRDVPEHYGGGYADALLSSGLSEGMESGSVEKPSEYIRHHLLDDPGTVVLYHHPVFVILKPLHSDENVRKYVRFLAGVEGIVNGFFDAHEKGFGFRVESQDMLVLLEEFRYGYLLLLRGQYVGRRYSHPFLLVRSHPSRRGVIS
ncbi:hypothetical protein SDC9_145581 [bioreactor metagenome]|uniref:Uncharacterized protein n=1 Tax=bioreactor metagenome TaxID=1076179 RepID=A0A645EAB1_9ZZZZ